MNILVRSSSFIMPEHNSWDKLKPNKILFSDYGDLLSINKKFAKVKIEILNIFLSDIINYHYLKSISQKEEEKKIDKLLHQIKKKISKEKNKLFVISFSSHSYVNIINSAKQRSFFENLALKFSDKIYKLSKKNGNLFFLELDKPFANHGYIKCFDQRNYFSFRCRLSITGLEILIENLCKIIKRLFTTPKKVLLLDCDNTIWGGVLGEEGFENLKIGQDGIGLAYLEFQKAIKKIKDSGVIIVILSKNNKSDVVNVFKKHKSMALKYNDITSFKVNWRDKSLNIKEIAKELYLHSSSFVFWDDNPLERNKVKIKCKDVHVIEPNSDIVNWSKQLLEYEGFSKFSLTKEDLSKTLDYQKRDKFIEKKKSSNDELSYLRDLNIRPTIVKLNKSNISRAEQLNLKTNQFNFSSKRYNSHEIKIYEKKNFLRLIDLKDDYGEHGLIGMIFLRKVNDILFVDNFLLSCRILGRRLENWILNEIIKIMKVQKCNRIFFEFRATDKNQIVKEFIKENNFINIQNYKKIKEFKNIKKVKNMKYLELNKGKKIKFLEIYGKKKEN